MLWHESGACPTCRAGKPRGWRAPPLKKEDELAVVDLAREIEEESRARRKWIEVRKPTTQPEGTMRASPETQESTMTQIAAKTEERVCRHCNSAIAHERLAQSPRAAFCSRECRDAAPGAAPVAAPVEATAPDAASAPSAPTADPDTCIECGGSRLDAHGKRRGGHGKCFKCYFRAYNAKRRADAQAKKTSQSLQQRPEAGATPDEPQGPSEEVVTTTSHDSHPEKTSPEEGSASAPLPMCEHCKSKPVAVHASTPGKHRLYCSDDCQIGAARARYERKHGRPSAAPPQDETAASAPASKAELSPEAHEASLSGRAKLLDERIRSARATLDTDAAIDVLMRSPLQDDELGAINLCLAALRLLPSDARGRALRYLETRLAGGVASA
jgi:hypothetical protein